MATFTGKYYFKSKTKSVVFFRLYVQKIIVFWLYLLRCWVSSWQQHNEGNLKTVAYLEKFYGKNMAFQKELNQIFSPYYYFCPDCPKESCCMIYYRTDEPYLAPLDVLDCIIYDITSDQITRTRKLNPREFTERLLRQFSFSEGQASCSAVEGELLPCPELTANGCRLPWGERRLTCVLGLCDTFARYMTWHDFWRYLWVSLKYLTHLTFHLRKIRSGLLEIHHEL